MTTFSPATELPLETAAMRALGALLAREQACLSAGDADACATLLEEKATLVAAVARHASVRHRLLAAAGFSADEQGMQQWLVTAPGAVRSAWETLMGVTREAHEHNRVNGMLLGQLAARNRRALDALGIGKGAGLYGPAGQAEAPALRAARVIG